MDSCFSFSSNFRTVEPPRSTRQQSGLHRRETVPEVVDATTEEYPSIFQRRGHNAIPQFAMTEGLSSAVTQEKWAPQLGISQQGDYFINPTARSIRMGLSWDKSAALDASAVMFNEQSRVIDTFWHRRSKSSCYGVVYSFAGLPPNVGDADDEVIIVHLNSIPPNVAHILFAACHSSHDASFEQVTPAYVRMMCGEGKYNNREICWFSFTEIRGNAMLVGILTRKESQWKFRSLGCPLPGHSVFELLRDPESLDCIRYALSLNVKKPKTVPLRQFIAETNIKSTAEVVDAYNHSLAENKREALHEWLRAYVKWFTGLKDEYVSASAIDEYATLIRIVPREPRDKRLIRDVLSSLVVRTEREPVGNRDSAVALSDALQAVDKDVFSEDLEILFGTAAVLLSKLDPSKTVFISQTGRAHEATLLALHQVLLLIQRVAPHQLNSAHKGFYHAVKTQLEEIRNQSTHFPITFHAETAKQTLQSLAQRESTNVILLLKRCLKGLARFYSCARQAVVADINVDSMERCCQELKDAYCCLRKTQNDWYDALMKLNSAAQLVLRHPESQTDFVECFENLMKNQHSFSRLRDRKFLAFGIVQQLEILATIDGPEPIHARAIDEIILLASTYTVCDECYRDPTIVTSLLDALARICAAGLRRNAAEQTLRALVDDVDKQVYDMPYSVCLAHSKLQQATAGRRCRDSTELFHIIRKTIEASSVQRSGVDKSP